MLLQTLLQQQVGGDGVNNARQFNNKADFPEGVSVAEYNKQAQTVCVDDTNKDIGLTFSVEELVLHGGSCAEGEDLATLTPKGENTLQVSGDEELAEPVRKFFLETFAS